MNDSLSIALKEWAAVCEALKAGRQSLLLRKGGIAEPSGDFQLQAKRFLLYPTFVHQQDSGLREDSRTFLDQAKNQQPPTGQVRVDAWAEVTGIYQIRDPLLAQMIAHLHILSDDTVHQRYHYRRPGLDVLTVRVHRLPAATELEEAETYRGCKSWVPLSEPISIAGSHTVLSDEHYREVVQQLDTLLRPQANV